jgi:CubicO group peptidase (beta-lactamase class C family)
MFDGAMLPGIEIKTMENSENLFPTRTVEHKGKVRELPPAKTTLNNVNFKSAGKRYDLFDYLALNRVAGLLILKNGMVVREDYELGIGPKTRWPSFSMGKSLVSTLIGAALQDGSIYSLDDPVSKYVPSLKTGAYEHVTVRNMIQLAYGVKWDETYTDPKSDRRKVLDLQLQFKPAQILPYMNALPRAGAPGTIWNYNTGDTFVVGAILEARQSRSQLISPKNLVPLGHGDAKWWLESPNGMGLGGGGIGSHHARLRPRGSAGLADGVIDGSELCPKAGSPKPPAQKSSAANPWTTVISGGPSPRPKHHAGAFRLSAFSASISTSTRRKSGHRSTQCASEAHWLHRH